MLDIIRSISIKYYLFTIIFLGICFVIYQKRLVLYANFMSNIKEQRTVSQVIDDLSEKIEPVYQGFLSKTNTSSPPDAIILLAFKEEKTLEMWFSVDSTLTKVATYPILGASGISGPKLKEGDKQVPEGFYHIEALNPNSLFYLSLRLNYPNAFDLKIAAIEGRDNPGSDIYIHGKTSSVGCLAMGDKVIEEIFYTVAKTGKEKVKVIISPYDFRTTSEIEVPKTAWIKDLYQELHTYLQGFNL